MSLVLTGNLGVFTNDFLGLKFSVVSPDVDGGAILQEPDSGRDGRGGVTFSLGGDSDGTPYPLYLSDAIPEASIQTFGIAIRQTATQVALGGRLLTLVDGAEDIFGLTTQVGINLMPDGTLQAVRANAQGTGIVLRGLDQGGDAQVTLLGTSTVAIHATDQEYVEIQVFHNASSGYIEAHFYDNAHALKGTWVLPNVNTAPSGRDVSTQFCYGGYASSNVALSERHHEDLQAVISDLHVINNLTNPSDANDPTSFIGDRAWKPLFQIDNATYAEFTPNPTQDNYLNVIDNPPDQGTTENSSGTTGAKDSGELQPSGDTGNVLVAYSALLKSDQSSVCISNDPVDFEAFVYTEQVEPSAVQTGDADTSDCHLTDWLSRRAQTVCAIRQDGESVTFKPNLVNQDGFYAFLTPVDNPPRVQNANGPGGYSAAVFDVAINMLVSAGEAHYALPWFRPWQGYAVDTEAKLGSAGDFFEFRVANAGVGLYVGLLDNADMIPGPGPPGPLGPLIWGGAPYTPTMGSFRFRSDIPGDEIFWATTSFPYGGQTVFPYVVTDNFRITRSADSFVLTQNGFPIDSFTPAVMPLFANPFVFAGDWGFEPDGAYTLEPGIRQAFVQVTGNDCVIATYVYSCVVPGSGAAFGQVGEARQWGLFFAPGDGTDGDGSVIDPDAPDAPDSPIFGYNENTRLEFSLESGNVVLRIYDWINYLDNITNVDGVGVFTYSRPYADTDDFFLQPPYDGYAIGFPEFPFPAFETAFPVIAPNTPLRLAVVIGGDSSYALPEHAGINSVSFQFVGGGGAGSFAGFIRQGSDEKAGTTADPAPLDYNYQQSMLASSPDGSVLTVDEVNASEHGYTKAE